MILVEILGFEGSDQAADNLIWTIKNSFQSVPGFKIQAEEVSPQIVPAKQLRSNQNIFVKISGLRTISEAPQIDFERLGEIIARKVWNVLLSKAIPTEHVEVIFTNTKEIHISFDFSVFSQTKKAV
jgi:hypothetical protein